MLNTNPVKLFIPGLFLLILGLGNLAVGTSKVRLHQQVLDELKLQQPLAPNIENSSSLKRLQQAEQTAHRTFQRQEESKNRMAFYNLVAFGGKVFISIGSILLIISLLLKITKKEV